MGLATNTLICQPILGTTLQNDPCIMTTGKLSGPINRILVINVARIGDTLLAVPVLRALRAAFPRSEIVCLAHPKRVDILQGLPYLDKCGAISKRSAPFRGWGGKRFDLALVFGKEISLISFALRCARHVVALPTGNEKVDRRLFTTIEDEGMSHAVVDRLRWLKAIDVAPASLRLEYHVSPEEKQHALRLIETRCPGRRPLVGFQIASFPTKAYRNWPMEHFAALGSLILSSYPKAQILILGDRRDQEAARRLEQMIGQHCLALAGQLTLRQSAALIQQLDLYIGVDTGPTHLAGALGVPMVSLYHCRHPGRFLAPIEHPTYLGVIEHPVGLEAATDEHTMAEISVEQVWRHVKLALSGERQ